MDLKKELLKLCEITKVSGCEFEAAKYLKNYLQTYSKNVQITSTNSVVAEILNNNFDKTKQNDCTNLILTAHLDEIGFIVTKIEENGFLQIKTCGGVNLTSASNQHVIVNSKKNLEGFTFLHNNQLYVNLGFRSKTQTQKFVNLGDRVSFKFKPIIFNDNRIGAKSLDDCAGILTILLVLEKLKKLEFNCNLNVIFSSQEEISGNGIVTSSKFVKNADIALCVDVTFAKFFGCEENNSFGEMSKGPMIGISPVLDLNLSKQLQNIAKYEHIPYQLEIMNKRTSTDADKLTSLNKGIKTCLCSIPIKYMHSSTEMVDLIDIKNCAHLISTFVASI